MPALSTRETLDVSLGGTAAYATTDVAVPERVHADDPRIEIITGDSATIGGYGPFDLLVLDGGPGSGKGANPPADPAAVLQPGGIVTIDDFTPMMQWPPEYNGEPDHARLHWLQHPLLLATEVQVADDLAVVVGRRK